MRGQIFPTRIPSTTTCFGAMGPSPPRRPTVPHKRALKPILVPVIFCTMPRLATELWSPQVPQRWLEEGLKKGQSHRNTLYNQSTPASKHGLFTLTPNIEASIRVAPQGKSNGSRAGIQHLPEPLTTRNCVRRWWKNFTRDVDVKNIRQNHEHVATVPRETTQWQTRLVPQKHTANAAAKTWCSRKNASSVTKKNCGKTTQAVLQRCEMR